MNSVRLFFMIGLFFSPIAALMAFLITYEEYIRHYTYRRKPFLLALSSAIMTFIVFMLISVIAGMVFAQVIK